MNGLSLEVLDLLGPGYLLDSLQAAVEERLRRESWQCYAGDVLRLIALSLGCTGLRSYREILYPAPADTRTAEEIAEDVVTRLGL